MFRVERHLDPKRGLAETTTVFQTAFIDTFIAYSSMWSFVCIGS